ncbi:hypothetical protein [Mesorhizobium sp. CAU 1741]|uniref:hypothetical protein n=1 Tax=Mesorhizobium sp. CAU 1741 TaxID=3140366 RepID=UPI00325AB1B6
MGTIAHVRINTSQRMVLYRDFIIQEVHGGEWEWCHEDYTPDTPNDAGTCQTMFECIDAVENWHDNRAEAAWMDQQQSLMESGGPDSSTHRRDMIEAGRGHLLGDR